MNLNSVELHAIHEDNGGSDLSHRLLVIRLLQYFGDSLVASSFFTRNCNNLAFQNGAVKVLCIIPDQEDDDSDIAIAKLMKICQEVNGTSLDRNNYNTQVDNNQSMLVALS